MAQGATGATYAAGNISNPAAGDTGSVATNSAFGVGAVTTGVDATAIGASSSSTAGGIAIGHRATQTGLRAIAIGTEMKSVGEVMAIGRSFPEVIQKALRMLDIGVDGLDCDAFEFEGTVEELETPTPFRVFGIAKALSRGASVDAIHAATGIDRWFISALQSVSDMKVKAEIERIGIKEKLDQIHAFIAEGDSRVTTRQQITKMQNQLQSHRSEARQQEERAESHFRLVFLYAPLQLADNQITISPVEWTN